MSAGDKRRMGSASHPGRTAPGGWGGNIAVATELRPLSVGRGFFVLAEERKDEPASRAGVTRIPL